MNIGITAQIITELTYNCLTVGLKRKLTEFSKYPIARFFEMINLFAIEQNIFLTWDSLSYYHYDIKATTLDAVRLRLIEYMCLVFKIVDLDTLMKNPGSKSSNSYSLYFVWYTSFLVCALIPLSSVSKNRISSSSR